MNLMVLPNQVCFNCKLYNNRPELLPDSNELPYRYNFIIRINGNHWGTVNRQFPNEYIS